MSEESGKSIYTSIICCESLIRDDKGVMTAIKISEGFVVSPIMITPNLPDGTPDTGRSVFQFLPLKLGLIVVSRAPRGAQFTVETKTFTPSGRLMRFTGKSRHEVVLAPDSRTFTICLNVTLDVAEAGNFRFEVHVDDALANLMVFDVIHVIPPILSPPSNQQTNPDSA